MKTQISRLSDALHAPWSGVYQQQGRMLSDADWNALTEIAKARVDRALADVVGSGAPADGGLIAERGGAPALVWGAAYVDGIRAVVASRSGAAAGTPFAFADQADFPLAPALPQAGPTQLYLDVWERAVTGLEAGELIDPGLHGADTTTRTRTMAQVKWAPIGFDPEDPRANPSIGGATLALTLRSGRTDRDPCEPCVDEIELADRVGNYLFRVEVHDVVHAGDPIEATRITLKWSRENGAESARVGAEPPGFVADGWVYEAFDDAGNGAASESHAGVHHPAVLADGWSPRRGHLMERYDPAQAPGYPLVRRWDGYVELTREGGAWTVAADGNGGQPIRRGKDRNQRVSPDLGAHEHGHLQGGPDGVLIELDSLTLELRLGEVPPVAGDYWTAEVREAVDAPGTPVLPERGPQGIRHHYLCLAELDGADVTPIGKDRCTPFGFPPLTDIHADQVCYDNSRCEMPGARTVQGALDHLCQERDLRWHNKHLHGWGIVCGLIVECCPPDAAGDSSDNGDGDGAGGEQGEPRSPQDCVIVTPGYALTCEGEDVVVEREPLHLDLVQQVEAHDRAAAEQGRPTILDDGAGTACLVLDREDGRPTVRVEPHQGGPDGLFAGLLDGTLLGDVLETCVRSLIDAVRAEFDFLDADSRDANTDSKVLVSQDRKKFTTVMNLAIQFNDRENGSYVWLSRREHAILKALYDRLRDLLQSKTFCAMFADDTFPAYPFPDDAPDTWFGLNEHTRVLPDPTGKRVYTYAGGDRTINVYDRATGRLAEILEMPASEGAAVTALACDPAGELLYAAASIRGEDTALGIAQVGATHTWERPMTILCDMTVEEMRVAPGDPGLLYATAAGLGLYELRPDALRDQANPKPDPAYKFNAAGHLALDPKTNRIFATAARGDDAESPESYDAIAVIRLGTRDGVDLLDLLDVDGRPRSGRDGLTLRPSAGAQEPSRLYVAVDPADGLDGSDKDLLTLDVPVGADDQLRAKMQLAVENTEIALAHHAERDEVILSFRDSFRLQTVDAAGQNVRIMRVPVQIAPTDVAVGPQGTVFAVNALSNTLTVIQLGDLVEPQAGARVEKLGQYRYHLVLAYYALIGEVLQYLKDCFCHHLLVNCPDCDGSEKIYLGCVEIRDRAVYNICNFSKRKYVKSFPTVEYWLSLVPVLPMIRGLVERLCCGVLPDFFAGFVERVAAPPPPPEQGARTGTSGRVPTAFAFNAVHRSKQTDWNVLRREQRKSLAPYLTLGRDLAIGQPKVTRPVPKGRRKGDFVDLPVVKARQELEQAGVEVVETRDYDPNRAGTYVTDYAATSGRLAKNAQVVLYQKNGRTVFVAEQRAGAPAVKIDPETRKQIAELEQRKAKLADTAETRRQLEQLQADRQRVADEVGSLNASLERLKAERAQQAAELEQLEQRKAALRDTAGIAGEIDQLRSAKESVASELSGLQSQVQALKTERAREEARIREVQATREQLATNLSELSQTLERVRKSQLELRGQVEELRSVEDLEGVSPEVARELARLNIRTIDELSRSSIRTLTRNRVGRNPAERRALIERARKRLGRD